MEESILYILVGFGIIVILIGIVWLINHSGSGKRSYRGTTRSRRRVTPARRSIPSSPTPPPRSAPPRVVSDYKPVMGFWQVAPIEVKTVAAAAIKVGYEAFDASDNYGNEDEVGSAASSYKVKTAYTKIDPRYFDDIAPSIQLAKKLFKGAKELIIMLHWPGDFGIVDREGEAGMIYGIPAYRELAKLCDKPSVSNFGIAHLEEISKIKKPYLNQIEINPLLQHTEIIEYCKSNGIKVQAFSPLASGKLFGNRIVRKIARNHGKSVAQVLIRYAYQKGADIVNVKTTNPARMQENLEINDFELSNANMNSLNALRDDATYGFGTSESAPAPLVFPPFPASTTTFPEPPKLTRLGRSLRKRLRRIERIGRDLIATP
jgi:diketogulonate reductase-like aldo/keto reductase